jgi:DNA processing protein
MDLQSSVALSILPGISRIRAFAVFKELREFSGHCGIALEEVIEACAPGADATAVAAAARGEAAALLEAARSGGILTVCWDDDDYPPLLRTIADPPPVVWVRGAASVLTRPAVAIVGSRAATPYALEVAARLGGELAERGMLVVSGLARGADGAAHRGCLGAGGATVGVLGCGPDISLSAGAPRAGRKSLPRRGFGQRARSRALPAPEHFPLRNRLISGISLAVVVVEANEKSGSLITARTRSSTAGTSWRSPAACWAAETGDPTPC